MSSQRKRLALLDCWTVRERPGPVRQPVDAARHFAGCFPADSRERFYMLALDARHSPMAPPALVSLGTLNASLVHPREVFAPAIVARAAAIIVAHNHPSGDTRPSGDDIELTKRLEKAGEILGVALLDHLVFSGGDIHGDGTSGPALSMRESSYWPA